MKNFSFLALLVSIFIYGCNTNKDKTNSENINKSKNDTSAIHFQTSINTKEQIKDIERSKNQFTNQQIDTIKRMLHCDNNTKLDTLYHFNKYFDVAVSVSKQEYDGGSETCISTTYWFYTLNKIGNIITKIEMDDFCDYEDGGNNFFYRILNDTMLEIQQNSHNYNYKESDYIGPKWIYYLLDVKGKLTKLKSNRRYAFTKFVEMTDEHPFVNYIIDTGFPGGNGESPSNGILELHHGFTPFELDYMRNEIFADYGYKFKSVKWHKEFSKQKWYKPLLDNVDDSLTTIEKKNIDFILNLKKELDNTKN